MADNLDETLEVEEEPEPESSLALALSDVSDIGSEVGSVAGSDASDADVESGADSPSKGATGGKAAKAVTKPRNIKYKGWTLELRLKILGELNRGAKAVDLCKKYDCKPSTLSGWRKKENLFKAQYESGRNLAKTMRAREGSHLEAERALLMWFKDLRASDHPAPLSHEMLKQKGAQ